MDNKKTIIASIIGVALLVVLVVGATFAYFTTAVTNDNGETLVTGKTDAIGSISLTNPTSNLHITLNAIDMAQDNLNTYWATNDATLNYDSEEVQRDIAVATLTGGEATTHYECSTTINVSVTGTMVAGLQTGDAYIQFGGLLTNKVDLKNVSSIGYPVTFALNGTDKPSDKVSAAIAIENRNANQNSIAGKELSVKFTNSDLVCKVVETSNGEVEDEIIPEGAEAFAIYSETDKSLRFYNNLDQVNVGDTYKGLKVTAKYTGFEDATYTDYKTVPWYNNGGIITTVVVENKTSPISTENWFGSLFKCYSFDLTKLDTSNVTNMSSMFANAGGEVFESFEIIGMDNWNTSNVTNMSSMFFSTGSSVSMGENWSIGDLSGWDTSNVTNMSHMFMWHIQEGISIGDVSQWNTSNVTNMRAMFVGASFVLDLSGWNVSKVTDVDDEDLSDWGLNIIPPNFN